MCLAVFLLLDRWAALDPRSYSYTYTEGDLQGKRSLWSSDNTTMHCIRSVAGLIFIDEVDLV